MLNSGIIELDIHGMNQSQAQAYIDQYLAKVPNHVYRIRIIHGYHGGTGLREMIQREYRNYDQVLRMQMGNNPGETLLILREL